MPKTAKTFTNFVTGEEVTPTQWQLDLKAGDFYIIESEIAGQAATIYGTIVKRSGRARLGLWQVLGYSLFCPEGEGGILHICDPTRQITRAEFEQAQAQGWPAHFTPAAATPISTSSPLPKAIPTHHAWTIYALDEKGKEVDSPLASLSRPQDWGDPRWHYEFFRFEWHTAEAIYVNHVHCFTDLVRERWQYPELFAPLVAQILQPGQPPQLCGREYLHPEDFWNEDWGPQPPFYDADSSSE